MPVLPRLVVAVLAAAALSGCSGRPCDDLPALQAEREERRAAYAELVRSGAPPDATAAADEELHAFEGRVYDLEQTCARR